MKRTLWKICRGFPEPVKKPLRALKNSRAARWVLWKFFGYPNPKWFINEKQLRPHYREAIRHLTERHGADQVGDYLEFGVCRGSSMLLMYEELRESELDHVRLFGFDSFEGLPPDEEEHWTEGSFLGEIEDVKSRFEDQQVDMSRVTLVKGFYSDTLNDALISEHGLEKAGVIMINCDMYSSTREALDFCAPLIKDEAIIIFDDWNPLACENKGEKRAFDEFLEKKPHLTAEPIGQYHYRPGDDNGRVFRISHAQ